MLAYIHTHRHTPPGNVGNPISRHQLDITWHFCDTNMEEHTPIRNHNHNTYIDVTLLWHRLVVDKFQHQTFDTHKPTFPCIVGNLSHTHRLEMTWQFCDTALWKHLQLNHLLHAWPINNVTLCDTVLRTSDVNFQHFGIHPHTQTHTSKQCWKPDLTPPTWYNVTLLWHQHEKAHANTQSQAPQFY